MGAWVFEQPSIKWSCHECNTATKAYPDTPTNREKMNKWADEHDADKHPGERSPLATEGRLPMKEN
jgi:hypothetical protein